MGEINLKHGNAGPGVSGYRKGCRCPGCVGKKRDANAAYRARKKLEAAGGVMPSAPGMLPPAVEASTLAIAWAAPAGPIESVLTEELDALIGEPPFKKTLTVLAKYNARVLDQIPNLDRPDLISGMQSRLFNVFDRLRRVETPVGSDSWDLAALLKEDD
ncbi:hypothetical protein [Arthrobacter silvisoli]|uniref:hypothetical protein n=1 Tax=Arthrobacter silvisoli TaxID=2291022 RepID=UPI000E218B34|nr:hypothetical protein [Arthrobacter silvisoli]